MNKAGDLPLTAQTLGCHFIGNQWVRPADGRTVPVVDPGTGEIFAEIARGGAADVDAAVKAARGAFEGAWGALAPADRGRALMRLSQLVTVEGERLARIESRDVGKPFAQSKRDIAATARYFEFYAGACDKVAGEVLPYPPGYTVMAMRVPFGVTGHIVPWNYPSQIFGRSVGAALAAGNACVLKPPEDASLALLEIAQLAIEAGLPAGALNVVTGLGDEAGAALSAHPGVDHISFTGSPVTGTRVAQAAAAHHCPVTLELGGKSPQIVFADADLDAAASAAAWGCFYNAGETCHASTRLVAERSIMDALIKKIEEVTAREITLAHPFEPAAQIGALIEDSHLVKVLGMIEAGEKEGTKRAFGAEKVMTETGGSYMSPGVFVATSNADSLARQEIFGPVLTAIPFDTEEEALRIANDTSYGLAGAVFTTNMSRAHRVSEGIHAGTVWINTYDISSLATPFGGFKQSGFGRDRSVHAIDKYCDYKTIWQRFS
jgi:gamma-glutamyl-gamma-aminobutyraldehyde dehydrogenase